MLLHQLGLMMYSRLRRLRRLCMHADMSEYPAGPVRWHRAGEIELNVQLVLSFKSRYTTLHDFWQFWQSWPSFSCCTVDTTSPSLFPESMQHAGLCWKGHA